MSVVINIPVIGENYPLKDNVKEYPLRGGLKAGMVVKVLRHHGNSYYDVIATDGTEGTVYSVNLVTGSYRTNETRPTHMRYTVNFTQPKGDRPGVAEANARKAADSAAVEPMHPISKGFAELLKRQQQRGKSGPNR